MNTISSLKENAIVFVPLKDKQVDIVSNFIEGHGAFVLLATGKACFACPHLFLTIYPESVAPLLAIMKDQVCCTWSYEV